MRRTLWTTLLVLAAALAACSLSRMHIEGFTAHARHMRTEAIEAVEEGDIQLAEVRMVALAGYLKENMPWLQAVCDHTDLHDLKVSLIDAQASIEFGIEDDFYQAIYRFGEGMDHIAGIEEISLANLY